MSTARQPGLFTSQANLVIDRVKSLGSLATNAYTQARRTLDRLATSIDELPLAVVDTDIGTNLNISWAGTISSTTLAAEPTYLDTAISALPDAPTVPSTSVVVPVFGGTDPDMPEDTLTDISETLPTAPTAINAPTFDALPDLGDIPEITAVAPTISLSALATEFSFTEPTYTEQISSTVKTQIARVLGGDLGIPSSVWAAMWTKTSGDLARQQVGRLRLSRNRGAASYWALPAETALVASRAINDEGARSIQLDRLQKATAEATMKREDFWQAVQQGIALEGIWMNFHESLAQRALGAAEQLANVEIQVHNANIQRYNLLVENAKLTGAIDDMKVKRLLSGYEIYLKKSEVIVAQTKSKIEHYQALWEGYKAQFTGVATLGGAQTERFSARTARAQLAVQKFGEDIKYWNATLDAELKSKEFLLQKADTEAKNFSTQYGLISSLATATAAIVDTRATIAKTKLEGEIATINVEKEKNLVEVEIGKLTQAAQEAKAKIDVAQAEWLGGQGMAMQQRIAELAFGYAQAAVSASQVSLGSRVDMSDSKQTSGSRNELLEWDYNFT